ncbi:38431_t:CDS:2 [Gigaspora margarita]|uniref:38431_t:CDS:1 n=1 Tax=Gigaspora margarita TaxID=4874 RepID=A0ABN7UNQ0_GIGMA|nr:38431_t:CDS:2 [Gigaspora margarita]
MDTDTNDLFDTNIYNADPQYIIQISDDNMATNTSTISDGNISLDISNTFNINNKILCTTTNSGSNMVLAMQLLKENFLLQNYNFNFQPHCYLAHVLNLIITSSLAPIKSLIKNVHNLVKAISSFSSLIQDLKEIGQLVGKGEATCKILQNVSTWCNSIYLILAAYITMPTTIAALIRCNNNLNKYKLTPQEESDLQAITQFLKPFYETTNVLSSSTYMTLGISIVLMDSIVGTISLYLQNPTSPEFLKAAATQMSTKVQKYANEIYDKIAFMAAILDPRVKLKLMPEDVNNEANRAFFNNIFRSEYSSPILNNLSTNSEINLTYIEQIAQKKRRTNVLINRMDEFNQYLNKAILSMNIDSLNW